jgi:glycosyltransferase involved in cell wall biosynthesis
MHTQGVSLVVISHAGIRQVNRGVYRELSKTIQKLQLVIPDSILLQSGIKLQHEPMAVDDPTIIPLELKGNNPRTYYYPDLINFLNKAVPDVILLENDPVSRLGWMLSGWARKNGRKIISQSYENIKRDPISTWSAHRGKGLLKNTLLHYFYHLMSYRIDALLVVNKDSESLFKFYKYKAVTLMPLGYDPRIFFPDQDGRLRFRQKLNVDNDTVLVAYFGRLVPQKGVHLLIEVLSNLVTGNWKLLLDHAFDQQDQYARRIQEMINAGNLQDRVCYFEANHFEIADYMRAADIMVAPSLTTATFKEQYGRAVQEAMACGCITVVSDAGHLPDLVGDRSLVFAEANSAMLRETLQGLFDDGAARTNYSRQLASRAKEKLTIYQQGNILQQVLTQLNEVDLVTLR